MFGQQYPWARALWNKDLPLVCLPQIPSCNSSRSNFDASGCMHSKYGPEKKCLYNFWSLNSQNPGAFLRTFLVSNLSLSRISPLRNITLGLVYCRRQPKTKPILLKVYVVVWVRIVLTESIEPNFMLREQGGGGAVEYNENNLWKKITKEQFKLKYWNQSKEQTLV